MENLPFKSFFILSLPSNLAIKKAKEDDVATDSIERSIPLTLPKIVPPKNTKTEYGNTTNIVFKLNNNTNITAANAPKDLIK
jgi:hypothetical protein